MATSKQLPIYEVRTDDGGVGLKLGDGPIHMGLDGTDLMRLLWAVFPDNCGSGEPVDGDLIELAHMYLDSDTSAYERQHELNTAAGWREW